MTTAANKIYSAIDLLNQAKNNLYSTGLNNDLVDEINDAINDIKRIDEDIKETIMEPHHYACIGCNFAHKPIQDNLIDCTAPVVTDCPLAVKTGYAFPGGVDNRIPSFLKPQAK